jgi:hypothetical protein
MSLETALTNTQKTVPECVSVGLVDMKTGMLLGFKNASVYPQEFLDLVAAATGDMFQGSNVTMIEQMFRKQRGMKEDGRHYFREIIILSDNLMHVFQRCKRNEDLVLVTIARNSANLGMVIAKSRAALAGVEAEV